MHGKLLKPEEFKISKSNYYLTVSLFENRGKQKEYSINLIQNKIKIRDNKAKFLFHINIF